MNLLRCNWRSSGIRMYNLGRQRRKEWKRLHTETQRIRSKPLVVGIRREDPSLTWERRVPLTPEDILLISKSFRSQLRNMLTTIHPYQLDEKGELLIPFELEFHVQPCSRRIIPNAQYSAVGAKITEDLSGAHVIIGIKEPRVEEVLVDGLAIPGTRMTGSGYSSIKDKDNCARTYMMFSHTTEGQEYNLPLLDLFLSSGPNSKSHLPTLIDYELLTSESSSKRILTFGFHAGLAGTLLSFHTLGIYQLATLGVASPFLYTPLPQSKRSVDELRAAFHDVGDRIRFEGGTGEGLGPCVVGITGTEDIADGCLSMLSELPIENILVSELEDLVVRRKLRGGDVSLNKVYVVHVKPEDHLVKTLSNSDSSYPVTGSDNPFLKLLSSTTYSRFDYYSHPSTYTSTFATHIAPYLTLLLNGEARVPGFPNLMWRRTLETCVRRVREMELEHGRREGRFGVVGDMSCDPKGNLRFVTHSTTLNNPYYKIDVPAQSLHSSIASSSIDHSPVNASDPPSSLPTANSDSSSSHPIYIQAVDILPASLSLDASIHFSSGLKRYLRGVIEWYMWLAVTKTRGLTWIGPPPNLKPKSRSIGDLMSTGMDKDRTDANQIFPVELPERLRRVLKSRAMSDADINALLTNTKSTNGATKTNASTESIKPGAARSLEEATFSQVIQSLSRLARFRKLSSATESSEWPEEEKPDEIREALFRAAITQSGELFERFRKTESRRLRRKVQLWRDTVRERDGGPSTSTTIATFTASEELATNSLDQSSEALKLGEIIGSNDAGPGNFSSPIATAIPSSSIPDSSAGTILDARPATAAKDTIADEHTDEYDANVDARNVDPCLLYIGHLDPQFESKELVRAFAKFGEILAACVVCTHKVGKSKTHAVVKFRRPDQAANAISSMNGVKLDGQSQQLSVQVDVPKRFRVAPTGAGRGHRPRTWNANQTASKGESKGGYKDGKSYADAPVSPASTRTRDSVDSVPNVDAQSADPYCLVIGHLDPQVSLKALVRTFSKFGEIVDAVQRNDVGDKRKRYAILRFRSPDQAANAISSMNSIKLDGQFQPLSLLKMSKRSRVTSTSPRTWKPSQTASEGKGEGEDKDGDGDAPVASSASSSTDGRCWHRTSDSSDSVPNLSNGKIMTGRTRASADRIPNTSNTYTMIARIRDIGRGEIGNRLNIDTRCLYVKNLPPEIDERALEERFGEFGHISHVGIKRSATGGRFGFVQYRTVGPATDAIKKMHHSIVVLQGKTQRLDVGMLIPKQLLQELVISDEPESANSIYDLIVE